MFTYSIDNKSKITDPNGNEIIDLTRSIFNREAGNIKDYYIRRVDKFFNMRPDLVAIAEYGDDESTEFVLKFSGISNPFTLSLDDILKIPNFQEAYGMMQANTPSVILDEDTNKTREAQIRNYFKFVNLDYKSDSTSYDALANREIKSGILDSPVDQTGANYMVPYISEDGRTSVSIRNGRIYFGENSGLNIASTMDINDRIQNLINQTATKLSDSNCMYNGSKLADFVRANYKND